MAQPRDSDPIELVDAAIAIIDEETRAWAEVRSRKVVARDPSKTEGAK